MYKSLVIFVQSIDVAAVESTDCNCWALCLNQRCWYAVQGGSSPGRSGSDCESNHGSAPGIWTGHQLRLNLDRMLGGAWSGTVSDGGGAAMKPDLRQVSRRPEYF